MNYSIREGKVEEDYFCPTCGDYTQKQGGKCPMCGSNLESLGGEVSSENEDLDDDLLGDIRGGYTEEKAKSAIKDGFEDDY